MKLKRLKERMEFVAILFFALIFMSCAIVTLAAQPGEASSHPVQRQDVTAETAQMATETTVSISYITAEPEPETEPEPTEPPEVLYEVPLEDDLQRFIRAECEAQGVPFEIVLAMIERESSYRPGVVSPTNDYGLMQINEVNHEWLREKLGITDIMDPEQNVRAGVYILGEAYRRYGDIHFALMAYNMGDAGAARAWEQGSYTSSYSRAIVQASTELEKREVQ